MPTYSFRNTETEEVTDVFMKMSERSQYLKDNPHLVQVITSACGGQNRFVETDRMKGSSDFTSKLKKLKQFYPDSTINIR